MSQATFSRPSRYRSLLAKTSSGMTRYSTISARMSRMTRRRSGRRAVRSRLRQSLAGGLSASAGAASRLTCYPGAGT